MIEFGRMKWQSVPAIWLAARNRCPEDVCILAVIMPNWNSDNVRLALGSLLVVMCRAAIAENGTFDGRARGSVRPHLRGFSFGPCGAPLQRINSIDPECDRAAAGHVPVEGKSALREEFAAHALMTIRTADSL
jgi:hypothetical protein